MKLIQPHLEGTIRLQDGRKLGFADFGKRDGRPLLWFHGTPGARRQIAPEARALAEQEKIRIISIERPGIGDSTPHLYANIAEFAVDIEQLSDALDIDQYVVAGLSGGGPYALSCAYRMQSRVRSVVLLGGVAPATGLDATTGGLNFLMRVGSPMLKHTHKSLGKLMRSSIRALAPLGDKAIGLFARTMPPGDQEIFADPVVRRMFLDDLLEGSRNNMQACLMDAILFGREWGFRLADISRPVYMFYGDADTVVPLAHGQFMAERLQDARLQVRPGEGHLGGLGATKEIFKIVHKSFRR